MQPRSSPSKITNHARWPWKVLPDSWTRRLHPRSWWQSAILWIETRQTPRHPNWKLPRWGLVASNSGAEKRVTALARLLQVLSLQHCTNTTRCWVESSRCLNPSSLRRISSLRHKRHKGNTELHQEWTRVGTTGTPKRKKSCPNRVWSRASRIHQNTLCCLVGATQATTRPRTRTPQTRIPASKTDSKSTSKQPKSQRASCKVYRSAISSQQRIPWARLDPSKKN